MFANHQSRLVPPHLRHDDLSLSPNGATTPNGLAKLRAASLTADSAMGDASGGPGEDPGQDLDPRLEAFRESYRKSEAEINRLFLGINSNEDQNAEDGKALSPDINGVDITPIEEPPKAPARRVIDEDDYGDDESEDDGDKSPTKVKPVQEASPAKPPSIVSRPSDSKATPEQAKSSEEARKELEEDKKASEDAVKRSFNTMFYTLENDRDAMLEQQRLEEIDRQVEAEMSGANGLGPGQQGKLSNVNLGASSLTLKHLIARIDEQRPQVRLTDTDLKNLLSEVKKNRSKWASEEKIGQEELYEAAEKVLSELKAMTEHSTAFLSRVNKREAPDYYTIIKYPMDLGTMTKKLKSLSYRSKKEFVDDLLIIWANCLRYNAEPTHFLRKHALAMRKETEKLIPLIPDIVIRDRAEVEAEERRRHAEEAGDADAGEDSDDEPILAGRGRKAPGKGAKKGTSKPDADNEAVDGTPAAESRPNIVVKSDSNRGDSHPPFEGSQTGLSTPPPGMNGSVTPLVNGIGGSQADLDTENLGSSLNGLLQRDDTEHEDLEYRTWRIVTKKDRAQVAAERHRLFNGYKINKDEPALLRTKTGMRAWLSQQQPETVAQEENPISDTSKKATGKTNETIADGMEEDVERMLPNYYDTLAAVPELPERLQWVEDNDGNLINNFYENIHLAPRGMFLSPRSNLVDKIESNLASFQTTRKICHKIGVIKQMQTQTQIYKNQFAKYNSLPFAEEDVAPHVVSDDGPIMADTLCRAALQRSVGKVLCHAGYEDFQPMALEAITDIAGDYFKNLVSSIKMYFEAPKLRDEDGTLISRYTQEEIILLAFKDCGIELESLETYVKDDVERLGSKLNNIGDKMKAYMAELLRPALQDVGPDGSKAFNDDSEQFVGGDFAEDINEDYFGFRALGLDKELGMSGLSVPLHLLQSRMHNIYNSSNQANVAVVVNVLPTPETYPKLTLNLLKSQIGLVQNFFLAKLHANNDEPLMEDDDLPQRHRLPKPKLGATGKIVSPRKRSLKEQGGSAKKKKKPAPTPQLTNGVNGTSITPTPGQDGDDAFRLTKVRILPPGSAVSMERQDSRLSSSADGDAFLDKSHGGLMSPQSMEA